MTSSHKAALIFYLAGFALYCGVGIGTIWSPSWPDLCFVLLLAVVCTVLWRRAPYEQSARVWLYAGIVLAFFAFGSARVLFTLESLGQSPLASEVGQEITIEGIVVREPDVRAVLQQVYVESQSDVILVSVDRYVPLQYGDRVSVTGTLKAPEAFTTDLGRTFDYPGYLLARGVEYQISFAEVSVVGSGEGSLVLTSLLMLKQSLMLAIEGSLPEPAAGLGEGLLLGVKQALPGSLEEAFRKTGIIHIVVLSGYNIMLVVAFVLYILAYFLSLRWRALLGIIAIAIFALMVGLSATVVRASIMAALFLLASAFGRQYLVLRGLLFAGAVMLMANPLLLIYDVGFQLSFMATFGLILLAPIFSKWWSPTGWRLSLYKFFLATVATQIAVLPLLLYHIGEVSLVAIIVNVLVLPMVPLAMLLTFITGATAIFMPLAASFVAIFAYASLAYIIEMASWFARIPLAALAVPPFPAPFVFLLYLILGVSIWRTSRNEIIFGQGDIGADYLSSALHRKGESLVDDGWVIEEEVETMPSDTKAKGAATGTVVAPETLPIFFR